MKLNFTIDCEPHEYREMNDYIFGPQYKRVIEEMFDWLRRMYKSDVESVTIDEVRAVLANLQNEYVSVE